MAENENFRPKSITEFLDGKHNFIIPSYQRGYRWNLKEIKDLLLDINSFSQNDEGDKRRLNLGSSTDNLHSTIVKSNCTETLKNINTKFDVKIL